MSRLQRILMIEDEPDIQAVAQLALESLGGFTVHICSQGAEAVDVAPGFEPDLILLDVMMPGLDGPSTLLALRQKPQLRDTPVVFMTAKVQPHEIAHYKALGVVDVVAKPFDPISLSTTLQGIWQRTQVSSAHEKLQKIANSFAANLPAKVAVIYAFWQQCKEQPAPQALQELKRLVHSLNGSAATFGFARLGAIATELDQFLGSIQHPAELTSSDIDKVDRLINMLRDADIANASTASERSEQSEDEKSPARSTASRSPKIKPAINEKGPIWTLSVQTAVMHDLSEQLHHFGYELLQFEDFDSLCDTARSMQPSVLIISMESHEAIENALRARRLWPVPPPIMMLSSESDLMTRLQAARAGVDAFFTLPLNTIALIDRVDALTAAHVPEPYRVLIVDDEPEVASYHAVNLSEAGMRTVVVTDPLEVMKPLTEFRPDVILMDMYMPHCDGLDLATVIRQQEDYLSIPIVFLSAETNRDLQLEALRLGGDDFMTKPILPDHLISSITSRVERSRTLRSLMVRDSLTGLYNHTTTKERLEIELARARRNQVPLAFAIIDIDHFKLVNDTYGHPTGDLVLKSLARLLQQRLRRTDVVGRYGGEEFAVVLPGIDGDTAKDLLDELRVAVAQLRLQAGLKTFTVTFSCGVAALRNGETSPRLTDAADRALYQAKHCGRNQVILATDF